MNKEFAPIRSNDELYAVIMNCAFAGFPFSSVTFILTVFFWPLPSLSLQPCNVANIFPSSVFLVMYLTCLDISLFFTARAENAMRSG